MSPASLSISNFAKKAGAMGVSIVNGPFKVTTIGSGNDNRTRCPFTYIISLYIARRLAEAELANDLLTTCCEQKVLILISGEYGTGDLIWLNDAQMKRIELYFRLSRGVPRVDNRRILSDTLFVIRNSLHWRNAPSDYGAHKTIYSWFIR